MISTLLALTLTGPAHAVEQLPVDLQGVTVVEQLGETAALDAIFTDHNGEMVRFGDYLDDGPVMLTMNYYTCGTLCSTQLNFLLDSLRKLEWSDSDPYRIVTVSIDPRDSVAVAAEKRQSYLGALGRDDVEWQFLVGDESNARRLADSVGFQYAYVPDTDQYAHPAALMYIAPDGTLTRYLLGLTQDPRELKLAMVEAGDGQVGTFVDQFIMSCFRYDVIGGKYTPFAFGIMRAGGALAAFLLAFSIFFMLRQERFRRLEPTP